ncbi:unnamed protein product, partial [Ectocarpus sp. 8 AP-2014]
VDSAKLVLLPPPCCCGWQEEPEPSQFRPLLQPKRKEGGRMAEWAQEHAQVVPPGCSARRAAPAAARDIEQAVEVYR